MPHRVIWRVRSPLTGPTHHVFSDSYVLSERNPFFFKGAKGEGIGGPHCGPNMIWPMSIIVRALTSDDDDEISQCLEVRMMPGNMHTVNDLVRHIDIDKLWAQHDLAMSIIVRALTSGNDDDPQCLEVGLRGEGSGGVRGARVQTCSFCELSEASLARWSVSRVVVRRS
jgi:hypothetical protein